MLPSHLKTEVSVTNEPNVSLIKREWLPAGTGDCSDGWNFPESSTSASLTFRILITVVCLQLTMSWSLAEVYRRNKWRLISQAGSRLGPILHRSFHKLERQLCVISFTSLKWWGKVKLAPFDWIVLILQSSFFAHCLQRSLRKASTLSITASRCWKGQLIQHGSF